MPASAAFFDLDRTILRRVSAPVITKALRAAGLLTGRNLPGEKALYGVFNIFGETLPTIALVRAAALLSKGWSVDAVGAVGTEAAAELALNLAPYALPLIRDHQTQGRPVILATTSPEQLVRPLAELLGFDDVVATRYAEEAGVLTGHLSGQFVWGRGKRLAVATWARNNDVELEHSYAYSDSIYDVPLLRSVGHPHAVNPDPRLLAVATVARWPVLNLDVPPGVPKFLNIEPYDLLRQVARPVAIPYARFSFEGMEHIPDEGPGIVVANRRSNFDPVVLILLASRAGRSLRFLGNAEVFDAPLVGQVLRSLGHIRLDGETGSAAPMAAAAAALAAGELVCVLPEDSVAHGPALADNDLAGRPTAACLAAETGSPVIPVGLWGTEAVWPCSSKVPLVWNLARPPRVEVRVGPQICVGRNDPTEETVTIMSAVQDLLPSMGPERR